MNANCSYGEIGTSKASIVRENAGVVSLAVSRLAALEDSIHAVNIQGCSGGNCLGIKPNTRHIWQTVYSLCCIFSTKHVACLIFSPNWYIQQLGMLQVWITLHMGQHSITLTGTEYYKLFASQPLFCAYIQKVYNAVMTIFKYIAHICTAWASCLFEGKLWATDGYSINKFP